MNLSKPAMFVVAAVGVVSLATVSLRAADPIRRPPVANANSAPAPARAPNVNAPVAEDPAVADDDPEKLQTAVERLEVLSAEAYVKLTELDLRKIDEMNQKMRGLYSDAEVDRFKSGVDIAKARVRAAREVLEGKHETSIVGIGQAELRSAQQSYERALSANRQLPGLTSPTDLERLKIGVEMARLNLERARLLTQLNNPVATMQWQLDELREQVRQLQMRITAITSRR